MNALATTRRAALIALPIVILIWSYNWIVMKQVLQYSGPFAFSALRFLIGTVVLFGVMLWRREPLAPPPFLLTALIGVAQTAGFQALVQCALVEGAAGRTALLAYTMPFWVVLLGWWLLAERPTLRLWAGLLVAAAGLLLVLEPWQGQTSLRSAALAVLGGLSWAFGVILSKRLFRRCGVSALSLTAWQMLYGTVVLVAIALPTHERPIEWSPAFVGALAYNGILASGLAWLLWSFVVSRLPASIAGLSSLSVPIAGIALAWLLLGERPSLMESLGIALIAAALTIVTWPASVAVEKDARSSADGA